MKRLKHLIMQRYTTDDVSKIYVRPMMETKLQCYQRKFCKFHLLAQQRKSLHVHLFDLCHTLLHFTLHLPPVSSPQFSLQCSHLSTNHFLSPALPHSTTKSTYPLSSQMTHQIFRPRCLITFAVVCPVFWKYRLMTVQSLSQLLPENHTKIVTFELPPFLPLSSFAPLFYRFKSH